MRCSADTFQHGTDNLEGLCAIWRMTREPQELAETIEAMLRDGKLQKDIARELGVSEPKVSASTRNQS